MSNPQLTKQCDIFTRTRKTTSKTTSPNSPSDHETSHMANTAAILSELKALRSDFGSKLDSIDTRLTGMAQTLTTLEGTVAEVKRDVSYNATRIEEAERCIHEAEEALEKSQAALSSASKRIAYLQNKTDDLENRGRRKNLRLFGIREGAEGQKTLFDFINDMLPRWLGHPDTSFTLERVHCTLASGKSGQNRAILIRFLKFQEKEFVYRESRRQDITHNGVKIIFVQDLSAETVRIHREFNPVTKLFVNIKAFRGFQHNPCRLRVLHNGKIHLFSTPLEAEEFYNSIQPPE